MAYYHKTKEIALKELAPGFDAHLIHTEHMTVAHVHVKAGSTLPEHHHINKQVTNIISGTLDMVVGGERMLCGPGTVVTIPANVPHSAFAPEDCYIIDVFEPAREDLK